MDTTQLLLTITLTITTILLVVIGIQLIFVLRELRKSLKKVNGVIDGFEKIGMSFEHGFKEFAGFLIGAKTIYKVIEKINFKNKNEKQ